MVFAFQMFVLCLFGAGCLEVMRWFVLMLVVDCFCEVAVLLGTGNQFLFFLLHLVPLWFFPLLMLVYDLLLVHSVISGVLFVDSSLL